MADIRFVATTLVQILWLINTALLFLSGVMWLKEKIRTSHKIPGVRTMLAVVERLFFVFPYIVVMLRGQSTTAIILFAGYQIVIFNCQLRVIYFQKRELKMVAKKLDGGG